MFCRNPKEITVKTKSGKPSILFNQLQKEFGKEQGYKYYLEIHTQEFLNSFGNWIDNKVIKSKLDSSGEPKREFLSISYQKPKTINEVLGTNFSLKSALEYLKLNEKSEYRDLSTFLSLFKELNNVQISFLSPEELIGKELSYRTQILKSNSSFYSAKENKIYINKSSLDPDLAVIHEIVHAVSHYKLNGASNNIKNEFDSIRKTISEYIVNLPITESEDLLYSLTNIDEFLVGIFTNSKLQSYLKIVDQDNISLFNRVINWFKKLLNIPQTNSLFDKVIDLTKQLPNQKDLKSDFILFNDESTKVIDIIELINNNGRKVEGPFDIEQADENTFDGRYIVSDDRSTTTYGTTTFIENNKQILKENPWGTMSFNINEVLTDMKRRYQEEGMSEVDAENKVNQQMLDWKLERELGTVIHKAIEITYKNIQTLTSKPTKDQLNAVKENIAEEILALAPFKKPELGSLSSVSDVKKYVDSLMSVARKIYIDLKLQPGDALITEASVFSGINLGLDTYANIAGTIDLIVIRANGDLDVYDYKTSKKAYGEWSSEKKLKIQYQLNIYKNILESKGYGKLKVNSVNIIPILIEADYENQDLKSVEYTRGSMFTGLGKIAPGGQIDVNISKLFDKEPQTISAKKDSLTGQLFKEVFGSSIVNEATPYIGNRNFIEILKDDKNVSAVDDKGNRYYSLWLQSTKEKEKNVVKILLKTKKGDTVVHEEDKKAITQLLIDDYNDNGNYYINATIRYVEHIKSEAGLSKTPFKGLWNIDQVDTNLNKYLDGDHNPWKLDNSFEELRRNGILVFRHNNTNVLDFVHISTIKSNVNPNDIVDEMKLGTSLLGNFYGDTEELAPNVLKASYRNIEAIKTAMIAMLETGDTFKSDNVKPSAIGEIRIVYQNKEFSSFTLQDLLPTIKTVFTTERIKDKLASSESEELKTFDLKTAMGAGINSQDWVQSFTEYVTSFNANNTKNRIELVETDDYKKLFDKYKETPTQNEVRKGLLKHLIEIRKSLAGKETTLDNEKKYYLDNAILQLNGLVISLDKDLESNFIEFETTNPINMNNTLISNIIDYINKALVVFRKNFLTYRERLTPIVNNLYKKNFTYIGKLQEYTLGSTTVYFKNMITKDMKLKDPNKTYTEKEGPLNAEEIAFINQFIFERDEAIKERLRQQYYTEQEITLLFNSPIQQARKFDIPLTFPSKTSSKLENNWKTYFKNLSFVEATKNWWDSVININNYIGEASKGMGSVDVSFDPYESQIVNAKRELNILKNSYGKNDIMNSYITNMEDRRKKLLERSQVFETHLEHVLNQFTSYQYKDAEFLKIRVMYDSIKQLMLYRKANSFGALPNLEAYLDSYLNGVLDQKDKTMELPFLEKSFSIVKDAVSTIFIGYNPMLSVRNLLSGIWNTNIEAIVNQTVGNGNFTLNDLYSGYGVVMFDEALPDWVREKNISFCDGLDNYFNITNIDYTNIATEMQTGNKLGLFSSKYMYHFNKIPDVVNRRAIFIGQMIKDGIIITENVGGVSEKSAVTVDSEGNLRYDPKKDLRFKLYFDPIYQANPPTNKSDKSVYEAYLSQKALYSRIKEELIATVGIEKALNSEGEISQPYTIRQIETFKNLSDKMFGAYSNDKKTLLGRTAWGKLLLQFKTWMISLKEKWWLQQIDQSKSKQGKFVKKKIYDSEGNLVNIIMDWEGKTMEGIFQTIVAVYKQMYEKNFNWSTLREDRKENLVRLLADLLMFLLGYTTMRAFESSEKGMTGIEKQFYKNVAVSFQDLAVANAAFTVVSTNNPIVGFTIIETFGKILKQLFVDLDGTKALDTALKTTGLTRFFVNTFDSK
jgi:hypothetical protein